ncbi:polysaccharide biosynthesis/export family protein [Novosphingobium lindaniclasticum]|uniref:polysaccharide biosynthesis/export family protein n=1 Tax=Novosphingobium lindaniclasticum TaxID=1329895 RepID=UPI0004CE051F|nr:polysaccharide biosynthesis/export family protein [Novosphingobium lindaniclasticum]
MSLKNSVCLALLVSLAGCATLPTSGPTGKQVERSAIDPDTTLPIELVNVEASTDLPALEPVAASLRLAQLPPPPTDLVGPGDVLDITIFEAGVTLFAGSGSTPGSSGGAVPGVQAQRMPPNRVDDDGDITIPYAGKLHVVGHTVSEVEAMIRASLRGISQNPQVMVNVQQPITNTVIVSGEVARPGRLLLQTNRETLSDVIALAGGYRGNTKDLVLRVIRRGDSTDIAINDLIETPSLDVRAYPGDRLMLINNPRTYSVLGAPGSVQQFPFARSRVSLTEALATAGGTNPTLGDPAAIFVFRYVQNEQRNEVPVVYHFNMMKTGSYFLAQRFAMKDKDVLYFGNAAANQPSKVVQLISQLFSPILTVTSAVQTVQNSNR